MVTVADLPTPVPRHDEVLVRVHAATVGVVDSLARRGTPAYARVHFGLTRPRFPTFGSDFAGQVEAIGPAVTRFAVGDHVFGTTAPRFGAHAQYVCLSEQAAIAPKPVNLSHAEAAALVDLRYIKELAEAAVLVPVIDTCYPLRHIVDAYRHVDAGHKKGNVVVTMGY
jgi:NADPH2:quinone reductase